MVDLMAEYSVETMVEKTAAKMVVMKAVKTAE